MEIESCSYNDEVSSSNRNEDVERIIVKEDENSITNPVIRNEILNTEPSNGSGKVKRFQPITDLKPKSKQKVFKFKINRYINEKADYKNVILKQIRSLIIRVKQSMIEINNFMLFHIIRGYNLEKQNPNKKFINYRMFALNKASMRKIFMQLFKPDSEKILDNDYFNSKSAKKRKLENEYNREVSESSNERLLSSQSNQDDKIGFDENFEILSDFIESLKEYNEICPDKFKINTESIHELMEDVYDKYESNIKCSFNKIPKQFLTKHFLNLGLTFVTINKIFSDALMQCDELKGQFDDKVIDQLNMFHNLFHNSKEFDKDEKHLKNRLLIFLKLIDYYEHDNIESRNDVKTTVKRSEERQVVFLNNDKKNALLDPNILPYIDESYKSYCKRIEQKKLEPLRHYSFEKLKNESSKIKTNGEKKTKNIQEVEKEQFIESLKTISKEDKSVPSQNIVNRRLNRIKTTVIPLISHELGFIDFSKNSIINLLRSEAKYIKSGSFDTDLLKDKYFNEFFNNKRMMKKFNYDPDIYKAECFSTDGLCVSLKISKRYESSVKSEKKIDNLIKPEVANIVAIDPGLTDFLKIVEINNDSSEKHEFPDHNDNKKCLLIKKKEKIKVISKQKTKEERKKKHCKSKTISTRHYYHEIKHSAHQQAKQKFDNDNQDYLQYIRNMPTCRTVQIDKIKKFIKHRLEYQDKLIGYWTDNRYKNTSFESYKLKKRFFDRLVAQFRKNKQTVVIGKFDKNISNHKRPPIRKFVKACKRNHIKVVEVDEFNTSKLCCQCSKVLRNYDAEKKEATRYVNAKESKFSKLKYCDECEHVIHRDVNASLNIGRIYDYKLKHDKLPTIFDKNNDQFGSKE